MDVGADENGLALLEDFVETGDGNVAEMVAEVIGTCLGDGILHDVVDRADRHVDAEEVAVEFVDAAIGTVADQGQAQSGLLEPILGNRQKEEDRIVGLVGREGIDQRGLSDVGLLIDKLAADAGLLGESGDGVVAGESLHAEGEPFAGAEGFGGAVVGDGLLQSADGGNRMAHVCFLREKTGDVRTTSLGETDISEKRNCSRQAA